MKKVDVREGQVWYLRRPGATAIITARITDVTETTVEIRDLSSSGMPFYERYVRNAWLDFVECIEDACNDVSDMVD